MDSLRTRQPRSNKSREKVSQVIAMKRRFFGPDLGDVVIWPKPRREQSKGTLDQERAHRPESGASGCPGVPAKANRLAREYAEPAVSRAVLSQPERGLAGLRGTDKSRQGARQTKAKRPVPGFTLCSLQFVPFGGMNK